MTLAGFTVVVDGRATHGAVQDRASALAVLNNALCLNLPRVVDVYASPIAESLFRPALLGLRRSGVSAVLSAAEALNGIPTRIQVHRGSAPPQHPRALPSSPLRPNTPSRGCWVGIDLGGTDVKAVVWVNGKVVLEHTRAHLTPLGALPSVHAWRCVLDDVVAAVHRVVNSVDGVGLSLPFLVKGRQIYSALSSKTAQLRRTLPSHQIQELDAAITELPDRLSLRLGAPCSSLTDGMASAAARPSLPGTLWLSLGTSITGALTGPHHQLLPHPCYLSAFVAPPAVAGPAHRTTGLMGSLQQGPTQAGVLHRVSPRSPLWRAGQAPSDGERLRAALRAPHLTEMWREIGTAFAYDLHALTTWLPELERVFLLGRLVAPPHPAFLRALQEHAPMPVTLPPSHALPVNVATHAQAWGALRVAAGARA